METFLFWSESVVSNKSVSGGLTRPGIYSLNKSHFVPLIGLLSSFFFLLAILKRCRHFCILYNVFLSKLMVKAGLEQILNLVWKISLESMSPRNNWFKKPFDFSVFLFFLKPEHSIKTFIYSGKSLSRCPAGTGVTLLPQDSCHKVKMHHFMLQH